MFIIVIPLSTSYYFSEKASSDIIVEQVCKDTLNSIELASNSIKGLHKRMLTTALYINRDQNITELLQQDANMVLDKAPPDSYEGVLKEYFQFTRMENLIENLSFNSIGSKNYISLITSSGKLFTNWPRERSDIEEFKKKYTKFMKEDAEDFVLWGGIETNYVASESTAYPHVFTIITNVTRASGNKSLGIFVISVPEKEFIQLISNGSPTQERFLLNGNGMIIAFSDKSKINLNFEDIYGIKVPSPQKGYTIFNGKAGKAILTYYKMDNTDWQVVDVKSFGDVTSKQQQNRNRLLMVTILCILVSLLIAMLFTRSITLPLKKITKDISNTDFIFKSGEVDEERKDEVGILQKNFKIMKSNINNLIHENKIKEKKKRDAELKALQAQISPHFLFNTLNTIRWAALNNNIKKAADMVLALSNLLHMTIVKGDEMITLEQELENLRYYLDILKMRHEKAFVSKFNVGEEIKHYKIPKLLLQPLVENAVIHGFQDVKSGGIIEVTGEIKEENVAIYIKDNGRGFALDDLEGRKDLKEFKFSGIGVSNVDERIKLHFGEEYGLHISSTPEEGTLVEVILPLNPKEA